MADRYWVGGTGTWNTTSTANWSDTSGGAGGASAPTSADNVIIDANSGTGTITCTNTVCNDITVTASQAIAIQGTTVTLNISGSLTIPSGGSFAFTGGTGFVVTFIATTAGKTITTNGKTLGSSLIFNGSGTWALGSALTISGSTFQLAAGSLDTAGYSITATGISLGSGTKTLNLNNSTVTLSGATPINFATNSAGFTFNAGTSTINCSGSLPTFAGGGFTFYNVAFTNTSRTTTTISGANTFNNITVATRSGTGNEICPISDNQIVNGTLSIQSGNIDPTKRVRLVSDTLGTQRTITADSIDIQCCDFRDIVGAGAATWSDSTRSKYWGNCLGNSGITFNAGRSVYWNLAGSQNWHSNGWAATNNGTPDTQYFPLAQDTATFTEAGAAGTVTIGAAYQIGSIQMADGVSNRTTAFTLATSTSVPAFYGNVTLFSNLTLTGGGTIAFAGQSRTQTITSAGVTWPQVINIFAPNGTVKTQDALTMASTNLLILTAGTLDLNNTTLTCWWINSNNANTRSIAFGTGSMVLTGSNATIWNVTTATGLSCSGSLNVFASYSGSVGTRSFSHGSGSGSPAESIVAFTVNSGTDTLSLSSASTFDSINLDGFAGTVNNTYWGLRKNLVFGSSNILLGGANAISINPSGQSNITTNGQTLDFPITKIGAGTLQLQDALTLGATRTFTHTAGTVDLNNKTLTCGFFSSSNSNTRSIAFGTGNITVTGNNNIVWTTNQASGFSYTGTPNVYLTYSGSVGTRVISQGFIGGASESNVVSVYINNGTDIVYVYTNVKNLDLTGFSGTVINANPLNVYGNAVIPNTASLSAGGNFWSFLATSGTQKLTTNGKTLDFPVTKDGAGTLQLQDALTLGATRSFTHTAGTVDLNGKTLTAPVAYSTSNSYARSINFGSGGIISLPGSGNAFNATVATNLTTSGTGRIDMTSASAKTFAGGGASYPMLNQGGAGALTITGANTFFDITNTVQPATVTFPASTTTSVKNFSLSGTAGNLVTINSSTSGTQFTLAQI